MVTESCGRPAGRMEFIDGVEVTTFRQIVRHFATGLDCMRENLRSHGSNSTERETGEHGRLPAEGKKER
jgi:hypothetical protein